MVVYVPEELEAHESVAETPMATVDEFHVEEGNPTSFPSSDKKPKKEKEVKDNGNESQDAPARRSA